MDSIFSIGSILLLLIVSTLTAIDHRPGNLARIGAIMVLRVISHPSRPIAICLWMSGGRWFIPITSSRKHHRFFKSILWSVGMFRKLS